MNKYDELLMRPYSRRIVLDSDGSWFAEIMEFSGCFATGHSKAQALENLEDVAKSWLLVMEAQEQQIPEPLDFEFFRKSQSTILELQDEITQLRASLAQVLKERDVDWNDAIEAAARDAANFTITDTDNYSLGYQDGREAAETLILSLKRKEAS